MKINLTLISIFFCTILYAQSNEIGIIPFKIEKNAETLNNHFEPKFLTGLYYQHFFKRFHWVLAAEYGENSIDDNCNSCADHFYGTGIFEELNLYIGFGKQWDLPVKSGSFQAVVRLKGAAMASNYMIRYEGGLAGGLYAKDRRYYFLGGEFETGLAYYHFSNIVIRLDYAIRLGYAQSKKGYPFVNAPFTGAYAGGIIAPKLSIGYSF